MVNILNYLLLSTHLSGTSLVDIISKSVNEITKSKLPSDDGKIHVDYSEVKDIIGNVLNTNYPHSKTYTIGHKNLTREEILKLTHEIVLTLTILKNYKYRM